MADLSSLKVRKVPAFLADLRDKHNALCDLIGGIEGSLGIDVHIVAPVVKPKKGQSKAEKPKGGKIRITPKKSAGQDSASAGSGSTFDPSALTARIAALETLTSGLSRQTVTYCSGGVSSSKTILMN